MARSRCHLEPNGFQDAVTSGGYSFGKALNAITGSGDRVNIGNAATTFAVVDC